MEHFPLGRIEISPGAQAALAAGGLSADTLLQRHQQGDSDDIADEDDREWREWGLRYGHEIGSIYRLADGIEINVSTAGDRSQTRLFLEEEYEVREVSLR